MELPILGATGPSGPNGGGNLAAVDREYAALLLTADGSEHTITMRFARPTAGPGGVTDLAALKNFDPQAQAMAHIAQHVTAAQLRIKLTDAEKLPPVVVPVESDVNIGPGAAAVVWAHVVSFQYLGEWDPTLKQVVVRDERAAA